MSSSTNPKPVFRQNRGSKAAIIRPVNRRDGKQTFVRIDSAENVNRPSQRAMQLEDYVAQIRAASNQPAATPPPQATPTASSVPTIVNDVAKRQQTTNSELTQVDHVRVLQAIAKLDAGQKWMSEQNRIKAAQPKANGELDQSQELEPVSVQTTTQPISQVLVNEIAAAISSVLTDVPESILANKPTESAPAAPVAAPATLEEETLKLSPELPKPEYTLPVSESEFVEQQTQTEAQIPVATNGISLTAAAWDVPAFRWPEVSNQILAADQTLGGLAENCESILSPFGKTIAVTAPTRGQGTTTMSITLARLFAAKGKRVLLIDADIMKPSLSKTIGLQGVSWYQKQSVAAVGERIVHSKATGVCVMPLSAPISDVDAHSDPLFDQLEKMIDRVRNEFDIIIVDSGPVWQIVDEISSNSHLVDVAMLVNQDMQSNGFSEARDRLMDRGIFKFIAAQNSFARRAG